jgi:4a-hydroxytetrahydrobiopterin dehydratase
MTLITEKDARTRLERLPGWQLTGGAIAKEFSFGGFPDAVAFVAALVAPAEAADHHPDLAIHYRRVLVTYSTHSAGGLTAKDFAGAADAEAIARQMSAGASASE